MRKITPNDITPGMVLAVTVKDPQGNILFLKGVELTERHVAIMQAREVTRVIVEGSLPEADSHDNRTSQLLDRRFSTTGSHPFMLKLKNILKELI
ncbi:MAG: hypothetical protein RBT37_04210 [Dissulfurispiraceae bacterium]|jgi:hypothetical protein|nr:hypothetical protein [Dissulfurispiraceae bacterium]